MKKTSIGVCNECGEDILVGEKYVHLDGTTNNFEVEAEDPVVVSTADYEVTDNGTVDKETGEIIDD